jgi:hypothetical protein
LTFHRAAVAGGVAVAAAAICLQLSTRRWGLTGLLIVGSVVLFGVLSARRQTRAVLCGQRRALQSSAANERLVRKLRRDQNLAIRSVRSDVAALQQLILERSRQQAEDFYALSEQIADVNAKLVALSAQLARLSAPPPVSDGTKARPVGPVPSATSQAEIGTRESLVGHALRETRTVSG